MGQLGLAMRPDHSGILLRVQDGPAIVFQPTGGLEALLAMPAMELLGSLVSSDIAIYVSMPGKPGHTNVMLHLNPALAAPVQARDLVGVAKAIVSALCQETEVKGKTGLTSRWFVAFAYRMQIAYIKFVGTHQEYDRVDAATVELG